MIDGSFTFDKKQFSVSLLSNWEHSGLYLHLHETVLFSSAFLSCPGGILVSAPEQYSCVSYSQKAPLFFLISSHHRPQRNPLFVTVIELDSSGVLFSPSVESLETSLISLFDNGILATHSIPQLEQVSTSASTVIPLCTCQCIAAQHRHPWACTEGGRCRSGYLVIQLHLSGRSTKLMQFYSNRISPMSPTL